jgi:hypothetical protein
MKAGWLGLVGGVMLALAMAPACDDSEPDVERSAGSEDQSAGTASGGEDQSAGTGGTEGGTTQEGGAGGVGGSAGGAGAGGADGLCDCGDDPDFIHAPLECACGNGECGTLDASPKFKSGNGDAFGWPYIVLYGTCASGHRVIQYSEACENGGRTVYDQQGQLAYSSYGPYGVAPAQCRQRGNGFGNFGIGESDPSEDCDYCVLFWEADGAGGADAGGAGAAPTESCISDQLAQYPACGPELYE